MGSDDKQLSQAPVSHLGDAPQTWFAAGGMLPGNKAKVSCKLPARPEDTCIRNTGREAGGHNRADARDSRKTDADIIAAMGDKDFLTQTGNLRFDINQC